MADEDTTARTESYVAAAAAPPDADAAAAAVAAAPADPLLPEATKSPATYLPTPDMPDLDRKKLAQAAFKDGDIEASKFVHDNTATEAHDQYGEFVKAAVFGGLDGIITTFAVVASVAGADLQTDVVLVMGFANLLADGVSMAFGEYIGEDAEIKYKRVERKREAWELANHPEGEVKEMVDLYVEKGFSEADATVVITTMAKYPKFFVDHMMVQELGLIPPEEDDSPLKGSIVIFISFLVFGLVPLLAYVCFSESLKKDELFGTAVALTAVALFGLGAFSSKFSASPWWRQGLFVMANGGTAAAVAYFVSWLMTKIVDVHDC